MENNKRILINFSLYFLTLFLVCIVGASNIFAAELSSMKFMGRSFNQYPFSTNYDPSTYNADYFTFNGADTLPNYAVLTTCGTGPLSFNISNSTGNFSYIDYVSLSNNTCTTQGYQGNQYIYYFKFNKWVDAGNGNFGVSFNNTVSNKFDYNTFVTYNDIKFTDSINLEELKQQQQIIEQNNQNTNNIINNQNQNNENLIDSNTQNTQDIINNNDENTNKIIDENKKNFNDCHDSVNLFSGVMVQGGILPQNGELNTEPGISSTSIVSKDLIKVKPNTTYVISSSPIYNIDRIGQYGQDKTFISRSNSLNSHTFTTDSNTYYIRFNFYNSGIRVENVKNIQIQEGTTITEYEKPGEEICVNKLDEQTNAINGLNDSLNDDDSSGASSEASDFFSSFTTNTFGLTSIITAPLNLIRSVLSSTCTTLQLPLPYLDNKKLELPCMSTIYSQFFGSFFTIYQTITYGIIAYWVCVRIFNQVKDFKNPEHDEIEVMDL